MNAPRPHRAFSALGDYSETSSAVSAIASEVVTNVAALARAVGRHESWLRRRLGPDNTAALPVAALLRGGRQGLEVLRHLVELEYGVTIPAPAPLHHPSDPTERLAECVTALTELLRHLTARVTDGARAEHRRSLIGALDRVIARLQAERAQLVREHAQEALRPLAKTSPDDVRRADVARGRRAG